MSYTFNSATSRLRKCSSLLVKYRISLLSPKPYFPGLFILGGSWVSLFHHSSLIDSHPEIIHVSLCLPFGFFNLLLTEFLLFLSSFVAFYSFHIQRDLFSNVALTFPTYNSSVWLFYVKLKSL